MQEIAISVFNVFIFHFSFFVAIPVVLQFLGGLPFYFFLFSFASHFLWRDNLLVKSTNLVVITNKAAQRPALRMATTSQPQFQCLLESHFLLRKLVHN